MNSAAPAKHAPAFTQDHVLGINHLENDDIESILQLADYYADRLDERAFRPDVLRGCVILSLFFEDSTRTRTSFEMAAKRLGADVVNIDVDSSSVKKGETLLDTVWTLQAMLRPDAIVIRHTEYGAPEYIANRVDCPVVNAGDSWREHPTQALLDALTIRRALGKIDGLKIAICGDIAHSRVASSNLQLLSRFGADLRIIAPSVLMPEKLPVDNVQKFDNMEEGLAGADIVMTIRLQKERMGKALISSDEDYFRKFGLTMDRLNIAGPNALAMDPGPFLRNVQIADDVADHPERSLILKQVRNGVPTRMAVFEKLLTRNT